MVERSVQRAGRSGAVFAASDSSTGEASRSPTFLKNACCRAAPSIMPICAAPMFEDFTSTSSTVRRAP